MRVLAKFEEFSETKFRQNFFLVQARTISQNNDEIMVQAEIFPQNYSQQTFAMENLKKLSFHQDSSMTSFVSVRSLENIKKQDKKNNNFRSRETMFGLF